MKFVKLKDEFKEAIIIICGVCFILAMAVPTMVFWGPFRNVRNEAMRKDWFEYYTFFMRGAGKNDLECHPVSIIPREKQALESIRVKGDPGVNGYDIKGQRIKGHLMEAGNPAMLKVAYGENFGIIGDKLSNIAENNNARLAINGGSSRVGSNGALPFGILITNGELIFCDKGPEETVNCVGMTDEGVMILGSRSFEELKKLGIKECVGLNFDDAVLMLNGRGIYGEDERIPFSNVSVIGQKKDGTITLMVLESTNEPSILRRDVVHIMEKRGVWNASLLQCGDDSELYSDGKVVNRLSGWNGEVPISSVFYLGK